MPERQAKGRFSAFPSLLVRRGIALPTTLILVLVLAMTSLIAVLLIGAQTRMAASAALNEIAFQAAEAGLRNVLGQIRSGAIGTAPGRYTPWDGTGATAPATPGLYRFNSATAVTNAPWQIAQAWTSAPALTCPGAASSTTKAKTCNYMIEELPDVYPPGYSFPVHVFRITSRAVGPDGQNTVMLQTQYQSR